ncbi:GGDEF domain-containing protein [Vibrio sp. WXL103]|uniref:sensor domain-containing diguanylate cyclase n=1 Tax=Vibrio sp. WXL103 TaxID=3450710 RepID=UPI003EC8528F
MDVLDKNTQSEVHKLKLQLEQSLLTQREKGFKSERELMILRRIVSSLIQACPTDSESLRGRLDDLRHAMEQRQDISKLVPQLAVVERQLQQHITSTQKHRQHSSQDFQRCSEVLLHNPDLPLKLKRDLRSLLDQMAQPNHTTLELTTSILNLYQRAIRALAGSSSSADSEATEVQNNELLSTLSTQLQHLITELDFEGQSGEQLYDIRAQLLIGTTAEGLLELTLQVLKLVIEGTHRERDTSEKFLERVNAALASSLKRSTHSIDTHTNYLEQRKEMGREINRLTDKSQQYIDQADNLDQLKTDMTSLVSQLSSLSERLTLAEQREQILLEQMTYSKGQLETLYQHTLGQQRRLEDQAKRLLLDPLTKVYNRSAFWDRLELEYRRWVRDQAPLHLVLIDIDKFKTINERFGYTAGDKALKIIARTISAELEDTDTLARFGGEEFALLLPNRVDNDCRELVKRIQSAVAKLPFKFKQQQISISLSVAGTEFKDPDSPSLVMERTQLTLNKAKKNGEQQITWC